MLLFFCRRCLPALLVCLLAALGGCIEGKGAVRVTSLKFTGVKAVKTGQLKSVLATAQSSRLPWGAKHFFKREQFEADLKRMAAFYKDRGYPDAKVTSFDVELNGAQDAVAITVTIDEGAPVLVELVEYVGFEQVEAVRLAELRSRGALRGGVPLDRALAQALRETALDEVKDNGFPYATVRLTERPGQNDRSRVLTLTANPGTLAHYGEIEVSGNTSISDAVVTRQLTFPPNGRYRLSEVQESQRRLYGLETFQFANIEPELKEGEQSEIVPVKVTVVEGKHRKVNFGIGYGTEEKARVSADWRHVNFLGGARTMQLQGAYSALSKGGRAIFRQPAVLGARTNLLLTGQSWHRNEPAYTLNTNGGKVTLERSLARRGPFSRRSGDTSMSLTYTNEFQSYNVSEVALRTPSFLKTLISLGLDPLNGTARGLLSSVDLDLHRSSADSALNAQRGYMFDAHLEKAGTVLRGDYNFVETILDGRYYLPLGGRAVVAVRARGGSIGAVRGENLAVPFFRRYFLGGATGLRGWGRFEVSPLVEGITTGGHSMFESSAELRVPVWRNLSAVLFADAGNVWNNAWDFKLGDLRKDVGPGLRYLTPIGPLRADLGYQLNPIPGLLIDGKPQARRFRFHFSIGQAF